MLCIISLSSKYQYCVRVHLGCGADLTGPSGSIFSPNYPFHYNHHAECYWTITVSQGSSVLVVFADLLIETDSDCSYDYVEVCWLPLC